MEQITQAVDRRHINQKTCLVSRELKTNSYTVQNAIKAYSFKIGHDSIRT